MGQAYRGCVRLQSQVSIGRSKIRPRGGVNPGHLSFTKPAEPIFKTISEANTYADAATERRRLRPARSGQFSGLDLHRPLHRCKLLGDHTVCSDAVHRRTPRLRP